MADGSGISDEDDFLIAVEEASQSGPLPEPPPLEEKLPEIIASPSPRRKTLISPTRPLPAIAQANENRGPVPDARKTFAKDRTTAGAPSLLVRASAAATPYPPMRLDAPQERPPAPRGETTKAPMPGPITVQTRTEGSRPIRLDLENDEPATARPGKRITQSRAAETKSEGSVARSPSRPRNPEERMIDAAVAAAIIEADERAATKGRTLPMDAVRDEDRTQVKRVVPAEPARKKGTPPPIEDAQAKRGRTVAPGEASRGGTAPSLEAKSTVAPGEASRGGTAPSLEAKSTVAPGEASRGGTAPALEAKSTVAPGEATAPPVEVIVAPAIPGREPVAAKSGGTQPPTDRSRTQPALDVRPEAAQGRAQPSTSPIVTPPRVAAAAARGVPASVAMRKAWHRVPNWVAAAVFGIVGLSVGVVIASRAGDDEEPAPTPAVAPPSLASAAPTPAPKPEPAPVPEVPVAPEPIVEERATEPLPSPEVVALADETPKLFEDPVASDPAAPRRRYKRRARPQTIRESSPEPEPDREELPPPPKPKPKPPSALALLGQAHSALARGDHATAYRLARRSNATDGSDQALALMAKAACRNDDKDAALSALRQLPLLDRGAVRRDCRKAGSRIGL